MINFRPFPLLCIFITIGLLSGCDSSGPESDPGGDAAEPRSTEANLEVPLRVAIFASEELGERIKIGWEGGSEKPVECKIADASQSIASVSEASDVIILPGRLIGEAVARGAVRTIPDSLFEDRLAPQLSQLNETQSQWNQQRYGWSLGSPIAVTLIHDGVGADSISSPLTFQDYYELAKQVGEQSPRAAEPLADGEAVHSFLRRAASYCREGWLFDRVFSPAITGEPYVRALKDLVAVRKYYPEERLSTEEIWKQMLEGKLDLAIGQPVVSEDIDDDASVSVLPPPVGAEIFDGRWRANDEAFPRRSYLSGSGLMICISSSCRQTQASQSFIQWMVNSAQATLRPMDRRLSVIHRDASDAQQSRIQSPSVAEYDRITRETFSKSRAHPPLRIVMANDYLEALDTAVVKAVTGEASVEDALAEAKARWEEITEQRGLDLQKQEWDLNR